jgi:hypothetical protein
VVIFKHCILVKLNKINKEDEFMINYDFDNGAVDRGACSEDINHNVNDVEGMRVRAGKLQLLVGWEAENGEKFLPFVFLYFFIINIFKLNFCI